MESNETRAELAALFREALRCLDPGARLAAKVHCERGVLQMGEDLYTLEQYRDLRVVAFGKAAPQMTASLDTLLGSGRASGIVVSASVPKERLPNFRYLEGGHPYPTLQSFQAAEAALALLKDASQNTLVIFLISGGGSAMLEKPLLEEIALPDAVEFHRVLVTCGANIYEMNVLRKHFSAVKGGRLALAAYPARQVTLYISDVPADRPSTVASGPTMPDESTVEECHEIAARYRLVERLPPSYRRRFEESTIPETPKPRDPRFARSRYLALLSNQDGIDALVELARARRWTAESDLSCDDWPLERAADHLLDRLRRLRARGARPACLLSGGELSCPVTGDGVGGRNQAFVLYCAMQIAGQNVAVLSAGTDGVDGNSPAAGAVADGSTVARARAKGLDPRRFYERSDSYSFFAALDDALVTGPTGNNVRDLRVLLAY